MSLFILGHHMDQNRIISLFQVFLHTDLHIGSSFCTILDRTNVFLFI